MEKTKVGIIGCGKISSIYLQMCKLFEILDVVACADINIDRAKRRAREFNIPKACSVEELLYDSEIEIIVNLTTPQAHAEVAFMLCHGHESRHPHPEFFYKRGGGPLLDMGPYYLTTLVNLISPIEKVSGFSRISFPERTITSKSKYGTTMKVESSCEKPRALPVGLKEGYLDE